MVKFNSSKTQIIQVYLFIKLLILRYLTETIIALWWKLPSDLYEIRVYSFLVSADLKNNESNFLIITAS